MRDLQFPHSAVIQGKFQFTAHLLLVVLAYYATGKLGLVIPYVGSSITLVWLPTGIAIAALLRWGPSYWPGVFLGAFLVNLSIGSSWLLAGGIAIGNTLGPLLTIWLLRRSGFHQEMNRYQDILRFGVAVFVGMLVTALGGTTNLAMAGLVSMDAFPSALLAWWMGDVLGALLVGPLLLTITHQRLMKLWQQRTELLVFGLLAGVLAMMYVWAVLFGNLQEAQVPLISLTLPMVIWAALRFGLTGASFVILWFSLSATIGATLGYGPFYDSVHGLFLLWSYLGTLTLSGLIIAVLSSERDRATTTLRMEGIFRNEIINSLPGVFFMLDKNKHLILGNDNLERALKLDKKNLADTHPLDFFGEGDCKRIKDGIEAVFAVGETALEAMLVAKGGVKTPYVFTAKCVEHHGEQVLLGFGIDITEQKRAEQQLAASESRLRAIIEAEPECVKLLSADGTILQMNPAGLCMLGADQPEQIIGKSGLQIVKPGYQKAFTALLQHIFEGGSGNLEFEAISLKGKSLWLETHAVPFYDSEENVTAMLGITRNITERKKAADDIRQRSEELIALLEVSREISVSLDVRTVLQTTTDRVTELTELKSAAIYLLEGETLHLWAETPSLPPEFPEELLVAPLAEHPHIREAIATAQPVFILDTATAELTAAERAVTELRSLRSILYLPLIAGTKVLGTLIVCSVDEPRVFSETEVDLCRTLANMAAVALEKARMYEASQQHAAELALRLKEKKQTGEAMRIAAVTFETQEAILITDADGSILRVNQAFQDMTGYTPTEVFGHNPRMFQSGRHDAAFYKEMWSDLLATGKWSGELWDKRKNGEIFPKLTTITAVYDDNRQVTNYVAVSRDISNRKQSAQEIHQLAFYDPLTKLPNRRLFLDRLQQVMAASVRTGRHGALLFLDMDQFKTINDTQGHEKGDLLLIEVARRLQTCVREGDSVARLGGDEFMVVLEELSSDNTEAATQTELTAEKIKRELMLPYVLDDYECLSSASIGISLFRGHQESMDELLKHAEVAMYQAKSEGRNLIRFFDPEMQKLLDARMDMERDLRHALEKKQFHLHFQIQMDRLHRPVGAEVLLRWMHPKRGLIPPMQFIPLAEETGLILSIGLWVMKTACDQLKSWQGDPRTRDLTLAVNVSAKQFRSPDFVTQVRNALLESGAHASRLKLELTESIVLENVEETIVKMREIKAMGVQFSMDDFGTGYSSLQYLKRLPLNQIKIDQSFVRDINTDPNDAAIVNTIIAMGEALGLNVIAEGVETEAQLEFLHEHGCHAFQGYLFSKPVMLEQFESQLTR